LERRTSIDAIEQLAAERLIIARDEPGKVVWLIAEKFPNASGLNIAFALCCVAATLEAESTKRTEVQFPDVLNIYRAASLLAADLFDLEANQGVSANGTDLLFHWARNSDGYFRRRDGD
jgi:hypothetical protein